MKFSDIFKNKFLSQVGSISPVDAVITLGIAIVIGLLIFVIYKKTFSGVMYSSSFNMSLLLMTVITAVIIMTISSNVVLSLGMVGARQYLFAFICAAVIAVLCFVMSAMRKRDRMYLLIVRGNHESSALVQKALKAAGGRIRNRSVSKKGVETIVEINAKIAESDFADKLLSIDGVSSAVVVNYNGEYAE